MPGDCAGPRYNRRMFPASPPPEGHSGASLSAREILAGLAVVVLNHDGLEHLGPCLEALSACEGLAGPECIVVADNASGDESLAWLERSWPRVQRLAFERNFGFAAGNNRAAEAIQAEWLLFLNNDTRPEPGAILRLAEGLAAGADCAGARLLDWEGGRLDFDGGAASFTGHGHALGFGEPLPHARAGTGKSSPRAARRDREAAARPSFFACGAAMMLRRELFLKLGGFAADYFAYYEDLDLGWRMQLAGLKVVHLPAARVRHRHHGSAQRLARGAAARLYERNALATVVRNYDAANLRRALPAALALAACRAQELDIEAGARIIDSAEPAGEGPGGLPLPGSDWSGWPALSDLALDFDALAADRARVQSLRRIPDTEVLPRLGLPFRAHPAEPQAEALLRRAVGRFELEAIFGPLQAETAPAGGPGELLRLGGRAARALVRGGPAWLLEETRRYRAWRRGRRA